MVSNPLARPLAVALSLCALAGPAGAQPVSSVGRVKATMGTVSIVRGGQAIPVEVGTVVHEVDVLRTGADGQLAIMLKDETRLSLGPDTEVAVAAFTYVPSAGRLSMILRVARGVLSYVSGRIAKLMPEAVRLETPTSIIGVRGTHALVRVDAP